MRIATYNVEWFNSVFDNHGRLLADDGWSGRHDVKRADQLAALAVVFTALDADAVLVVEAPDDNRRRSTVKALENFSHEYGLRARKALLGFRNDTQQEIALLYNPDVLKVRHDPLGAKTGKAGSADAPRFDGVFRWDADVDSQPELTRFSKPPLEVEMTVLETGARLRLIGVHGKSKAPHGAKNEHEVRRISIQNRRKQMAQCIWLRQRVEQHLAVGDSLIVLGDFNDGPGLDEYEKLFGQSGVEVVLGEGGASKSNSGESSKEKLFDPHAQMALSRQTAAWPTTARFWQNEQKLYLEVLLDYIMLSLDLCECAPKWRIWHPFDDPVCAGTAKLRAALLAASDHFPVSVDLDI